MKAMVRKKTERFDEIELTPEFMCGNLNDGKLLNRLHTNTIGLTEIIALSQAQPQALSQALPQALPQAQALSLPQARPQARPQTQEQKQARPLSQALPQTQEQKQARPQTQEQKQELLAHHTNINMIYNELVASKPKLRLMILGGGANVQTNIQQMVESKVEEKVEEKVEKKVEKKVESLNDLNNEFVIAFMNERRLKLKTIYITPHINCLKCINRIAAKLFTNETCNTYTIDNKIIYMSYNFLLFQRYFFHDEYKKVKTKEEQIDVKHSPSTSEAEAMFGGDRWYFVVFDNIVLIEIELVAIYHYADILPVYDWKGRKINPQITGNQKLIIEDTFNYMIGIYNIHLLNRPDVQTAVNSLTLPAKILLKFNFLVATYDRYNISKELVKSLNSVTVKSIKTDISKARQTTVCPYAYNESKNIQCIFNNLMANNPLIPTMSHNEQFVMRDINIKINNHIWSINDTYDNIFPNGFSSLYDTVVQDQPQRPYRGGSQMTSIDKYILNKNKYAHLMRLHNFH